MHRSSVALFNFSRRNLGWVEQKAVGGAQLQTFGRGPNPIVFINGASELSKAFGEQLQWVSGAIYAGFPSEKQQLTEATREMGIALDHYGPDFFHLVGHSWGAHIAAAFAREFVERVGCFFLLDTPLINKERRQNFSAQRTLAALRRNPNVNEMKIKEAEKLLQPMQPLLLDESDHSSSSFATLSPDDLESIQHPMCIIRCEEGGWIDDETEEVHRSIFNVRKVVRISGCKSHNDLQSEANAPAIAKAIDEFLADYDWQHYVENRLDSVRSRLSIRSTPSSAGGTKSGSGKADPAGGGGKKPKEGKKGPQPKAQ